MSLLCFSSRIGDVTVDLQRVDDSPKQQQQRKKEVSGLGRSNNQEAKKNLAAERERDPSGYKYESDGGGAMATVTETATR